mmetsp:Transcript_21702/g.42360  ORF Transcript_21702/g.42360 Transcript_21702/m.42360 type:complete len:238 (-) Transcript_21702:258-971(-)
MEVAFNKLLEQLASQHVALLSSSGEIGPRASVCCDQLLHPAPTNVQVEDAKVEPCEPMANEEAEPWVQTTDEDEEDDIATPHSSFNRQVSISNLREFRVREEYNVGNEELRFVRSKRFDLQEAMKQLAQKQKQQLDFRIFHKRIMDSEEEDIENAEGSSCTRIPAYAWCGTFRVLDCLYTISSLRHLAFSCRTKGFWSLDILLHFFTGFYDGTVLLSRGCAGLPCTMRNAGFFLMSS